MNRPQPTLRPAQEGEGRKGDDGQPEVKRKQPAADQPHVVVQGQPADGYVRRAHLDACPDGAHVGQDVLVGQHHPAGLPRASRGVLDQGRIAGIGRGGEVGRIRRPRQLLRGGDHRQRGHPRPEQPGQALRLPEGYQRTRPCVLQDGRLPASVLFHLVGPHGRVNGHRHGSGQQDPEEAEEEVVTGG